MSELTLVEFLTQRLDEDERTDMGMPHRDWCRQFGGWPGEPETYEPCTCGVSARVLVEVEAKRAIVAAHPHRDEDDLGCQTCNWTVDWSGSFREPCPTLRLLALPFADHPDYDERWRP